MIKRFMKSRKKSEYWLTRFVFLRLLGFVYFFAFLSLAYQVIPLIGEEGLLPADDFLDNVGSRYESKGEAFIKLPSIFWVDTSDNTLRIFAWSGVVLSIVILIGFANVPLLLFIWFLYMSFVHIGQIWYGFGWEIQLLETGFLAIFLVPLLDPRPFPKTPPPTVVIWLLRWLVFRIHLGSGLIKLRGASCWRDLTCLFYHYETQPIPNPLSVFFHFLPKVIHKLGALWSHFIQLIVPYFVFWPRIGRHIAGVLLISFQFILILSGNLSFLNWVTILPIIALFDDSFFSRILPKFLVKKADEARKKAKKSRFRDAISWTLVIVVALLSVAVVQNLLSSNQAMNTSFNQLHLVNTYGAFGSVGKERYELIVQGTSDKIITAETEWKEYEFKAKPGDVNRSLPFIAPYQPRIDWQIWFAAMSTPQRHPWMLNLIWKLLHNDPNGVSLIAYNPFPEKPPEFIRVEVYRYEFLRIGEDGVWKRIYIGSWLPALSKDNVELNQFIRANKWD